MNIHFNIDYCTAFGEELLVNVKREGQNVSAYRMHTYDGRSWHAELTQPDETQLSALEYFYTVEDHGHETRREWALLPHRLELTAIKAKDYETFDRWHELPEDAYLYSSAFSDCIHRHVVQAPAPSHFARTVRVKVLAPQLPAGYELRLVGSSIALGAWDVSRGVRMTEHAHCEWQADVLGGDEVIEMKFVAVKGIADDVLWETGYNRILPLDVAEEKMVVYELDQAFFALRDTRVSGVLVPVFSLRSEGSQGIGDFGDLGAMVSWVANTGGKVVQILPINDTTTTRSWTDSYPYNAVSAFALHPIYVDLRQLPASKDKAYEEKRKALNALPQVDYEQTLALKEAELHRLFKQQGQRDMKKADYKTFFADNSHWLSPYADFCARRDGVAGSDYYIWVQWVLAGQLSAVHYKARSLGVVLKGDIPIGVNRYGADVEAEPRYFNMNGQAGAPPDSFSVKGQNWGFPTYNWDEMLADGCQWWVRRFVNMSKYFDAYRIDHVLGFFRIWEIPTAQVNGLLGQFSPSLGLYKEEIAGYGFAFREEEMTKPFIADWTLDRVFGPEAQMVKETYLLECGDHRYQLRPDYDTERKIEAKVEAGNLRDGLYSLVSCVLFVKDKSREGIFHPRITAQLDFAYETLDEGQKAAFNRLYDDYYYRRNNHFWYSEAMKKLPRLVEATRMLVCAEDLGMVPDCVAWVMNQLRILSLEIESMPKEPGRLFGQVERNPYRSVCTLFSHDMPTLRQWWDEDEARTNDYYHNVLHRGGEAPHPLPGWLARDIVRQQLLSPSMLCVLSIQDWMAIDEQLRLPDPNGERINIPANPRHYWRYRMHVTIEQLMANESFSANVKQLIQQTGRN